MRSTTVCLEPVAATMAVAAVVARTTYNYREEKMGDHRGRSTIVFIASFFFSLLFFFRSLLTGVIDDRSQTASGRALTTVEAAGAIGQRTNVNVYKRLMETTICSYNLRCSLFVFFLSCLPYSFGFFLHVFCRVSVLAFFISSFSVSGSLSLSSYSILYILLSPLFLFSMTVCSERPLGCSTIRWPTSTTTTATTATLLRVLLPTDLPAIGL